MTESIAVPALSTVEFDAEFQTVLSTVGEHAVSCGRLDCGHLGKGSNPSVRRAIILYTATGAGCEVNLDVESPEVAAVYGVMVAAGQERPTYTRATGDRRYTATGLPGMALTMPNPWPLKITRERRSTIGLMLLGQSATSIAATRDRSVETIKSHAGYLRRETGAHDAVSAMIALVIAGKLTDRAITVTEAATRLIPSEPVAEQD